ncbi:MAG: hypothetical protein LBQ94_02500 [Treponema sp.]|nr:hypothetical protein [Treponema sp.]
MNKNIFSFELDGKQVLGFDTALDPRSFAQAKMADCITQHGAVIHPDGTVEYWQPSGVTEYRREGAGRQQEGTMVIWGSDFPGEELAAVISEEGRGDEALDAIRFWLKAAAVMGDKLGDASYHGPAGAFIATGKKSSPKNKYPVGTVFFPPARLLKRTIDAAGDEALLEAGRFFHPDLKGDEAVSFSAGAMLYRVFCGSPPFGRDKKDVLRQDIREGVFIPPNLAKPGLSAEMSGIISGAMKATAKSKEPIPRPTPDHIAGILGPPYSRKVSSWIDPLSDEELSKIRAEHERYEKKSASTVKVRRFLVRYRVAVIASLAAFIALIFIIVGAVRRQAELPTTRGMNPVEVAQAYYGAIGDLNSELMEACVSGRAGRDDISMVTNFFVVTRVRQGYEMRDAFMSAQRWVDAGRPLTYDTIFGVTDLRIGVLSAGETDASLEADYILWIPGEYSVDESVEGSTAMEPGDYIPVPPVGVVIRDRLTLAFEKDQWRITAIERISRPLE